jgi:hypothetical protein
MRLLKLAVEKQMWDLAAHTIVLATARILNKGDMVNVGENKKSGKLKGRSPK